MARSFMSNPDNAPKKQAAYKSRLEGLDDVALFNECRDKIWFSAYASNNPISCYHWQCTACYGECTRRGKEEIYDSAHKAEMRAAGHA